MDIRRLASANLQPLSLVRPLNTIKEYTEYNENTMYTMNKYHQ